MQISRNYPLLIIAVGIGFLISRLTMDRSAVEPENIEAQGAPQFDEKLAPLPHAEPAVKRKTGQVHEPRHPSQRGVHHEAAQVVTQEVAPLPRHTTDLDQYLDTLAKRATQQRRVSAAEVLSGLRAIEQFEKQLGREETFRKTVEFSNRMAVLSKALASHLPDESAQQDDPDALLTQIEATEEKQERQPLIRRYLKAIQTLDPDTYAEALHKLNQIHQQPE